MKTQMIVNCISVAKKAILLGFFSIVYQSLAYADVELSFSPANVNIAVGETQLVEVRVADVQDFGLAAFQLRLLFNDSITNIIDPNAPNAPANAYEPLGGNIICGFIRTGDFTSPCPDEVWFLSSTGRTINAKTTDDSNPGILDLAFASSGSQAAPVGEGVIAMLQIVGVANGSYTLSLENVAFADTQDPPLRLPFSLGSLNIQVGGATNTAPVVTAIPQQQNTVTDSVSLQVQAVDADADTLNYSATGLPSGLTINSTTGLISGVLDASSIGTSNVTVSVDDSINPAVDISFDWIVDALANQLPVVTNPGNQNNAEGDSVNLAIVASDADGDTLSYSATGLPNGLSINPTTGVISGDVAFDAAGTTAVTITVSDGSDSSAVNFDWTVSNTNQLPEVTNPGNQSNAEGDSINLAIVASDADGDTLSYSATGLPNGLSMNPGTGVISGDIAFDAAGTSTVTITVSDGTDSSAVNFDWIVNNTNRAPVLANIGDQSVDEGDVLNVNITAADPDVSDVLSFSATGLPAFANLIDNGDGTAVLQLNPDFSDANNYMITVEVSDDAALVLTDNETFTLSVNNINQLPVVTNPSNQNNAEGDSVNLAIVASDADGDTLSYSATGLPNGLSMNPGTGVISGDIAFDAAGTSTVTITVSDGTDSSAINFDWTVSNTNQLPEVTNPGSQSNAEGDSVNVAIVASDADGDSLSYSATGLPNGLSMNPSTGVISGDIAFDAAGTTAATVTVSDGSDSSAVNFDWTVSNTNRAPLLNNVADQVLAEGDNLNVNLNATDPDGDNLVFSATGLPVFATLVDNGDGSAVIQLLPGFGDEGSYPVTVIATDTAIPALSDNVNFNIVVGGTNRVPQATNPGDQVSSEGDNVSLQIVASDLDGDQLTYIVSGLPAGLSINSLSGLISGDLDFVSAGNFNVSVTVTDDGVPNLSTNINFAWLVNNVNQLPAVTNPGNQTNAEGDSVNLAIVASDADGDALSYSATGLPNGLSINPTTGVISGDIAFDAAGTTAVTITVSDGTDSSAINFDWTVSNTNQLPEVTNPGSQSNAEGDSVNVAIVASDADGDSLSYSATGLPNGLSMNPSTGVISGDITFDAAGISAVTVTVSDGVDSSAVSFDWTVNNTNRAPVLSVIANQNLAEGDNVQVNLSASDEDNDNLSFSATGLPAFVSLVDNNDGTAELQLSPGFADAGNYTFVITVEDDGLPVLNDSQSVDIVVGGTNRVPVLGAIDNVLNVNEGEVLNVNLSATDQDIIDVLSFDASGLPGFANLVDNGDGTAVLTITPDFSDAANYPIAITVSDDGIPVLSDSQNTVIQVNNVNRAPVLSNIANQTNAEGDSVNLAIVASDADGDTLSYSATGLPNGLSINSANGLISGTVGLGAELNNVTVTVSDGLVSADVNFNWLISNTNRPPELASIGSQTLAEGEVLVINLSAIDPNGDAISFSVAGLPDFATLSDNNDGTATISVAPGFDAEGVYTLTATVTDDGTPVLSDSEIFELVVVNTNRAPQLNAIADPLIIDEGTVSNINLSASDPDGDGLTYTATDLPAFASLVDNGDGTAVLTISSDFVDAGDYLVSIFVTDNGSPQLSDSQVFTIQVNNINRVPLADAGADQNVQINTLVTLDASSSSDPDADVLSFNWSFDSVPVGSVLTNAALNNAQTPSASFTPDVDGNYALIVEVSDGEETASDTVTIVASSPANVAPNAIAGSDQFVMTLSVVNLDGSVSNDPDAGPSALTFNWTFISVPVGSALTDADIVSANLATASFTPDVDGDYELQLEVSDGENIDQDTLIITADTPNVPPTADAGADQTVIVNTFVTLDGSNSNDPDNGPDVLTFSWQFVSVPIGSLLTNSDLINAQTDSAEFIPDVAGVYLLRLDVSDSEEGSFDQVMIEAEEAGVPPSTPQGLIGRAKFLHVNIKWQQADNTDEYIVYRRLNSETGFVETGRVTNTVFIDDMPVGTLFAEYFVIAENDIGQSAQSSIITIQPGTRR